MARLLALLLLLPLPLGVHNGAVAMAVPVAGIAVDGDLSDWPDGLPVYPIQRFGAWVAPTDTVDLHAWFRVGHDPVAGAVYLAVEVRDQSAVITTSARGDYDTQDGCEVYLGVHGESTRPGQYNLRGNARLDGAVAGAVRRTGPHHAYEWRLAAPPDSTSPAGPVMLTFDVAVVDRVADGGVSWVSWGPGGVKAQFPSDNGDLLLVPAEAQYGTLSGTLTWAETGEPVRRGRVRVDLRGEGHHWFDLRTGADGTFRIAVPEGSYAVRPGFGRSPVAAEVAQVIAGDTARVAVSAPAPVGSAPQQVTFRTTPAGPGIDRGPWHTLASADGMTGLGILAMAQDAGGDLWFSHWGGVTRYDGYTTTEYTEAALLPADASRVYRGSNGPTALLSDGHGSVWITFDGYPSACRLDGSQLVCFTLEDGLVGDQVHGVARDGRGQLWFATGAGVTRYDGHAFANYTVDDGLAAGRVNEVAVDGEGNLWFATAAGVARYDGHSFEDFSHADGLVPGDIEAIAADRQGNLWLGGRQGLSRYDGRAFTAFGDTIGWVRDVAADPEVGVWIGTRGGLLRHDGKRLTRFGMEDGLGSQVVGAVLVQADGTVWAGTGDEWQAGTGLSRFLPDRVRTFTTRDGLVSDHVVSLIEDSHGHLWLATWEGVSRFDGSRFETMRNATPATYSAVLVEDTAGRIWTGGPLGLVAWNAEAWQTYGPADGVPETYYVNGFRDREGHLWFSGGTHTCRFDGQGFRSWPVPSTGYNDAITQDERGRIWIVSPGTGTLSIYDHGEFAAFAEADSLPGVYGTAVYSDRNGRTWFAKQGQGLFYRDGQQLSHLSMEQGFPGNLVTDITQDDRGHMWFADYGSGFFRYDGRVLQPLGQRQGLPHDGVQSVIQDRAGDFWIASEGGLTRYRPGRTPPHVAIADLVADRRLGPLADVRLSASQGYLAIEFQGRSLSASHQDLAYVYQLQGRDDTPGATRQKRVEYIDLPVGEYLFQVQAVDGDLNYSEPAEVRVRVRPAYGQIALMGGLGLSLIGLVAAGRYGLGRRRERDQARSALVRERRQRLEVQPHDIDRWTLDDFVTHSQAMRRLLDQVRDLQRDDGRTLITGEAGTGKELVARAIHAGSRRRDRAFVPVRCAGLPADLASLEQRTAALSELFGHVRGAFAGADADRLGALQQAQGGTLYLDEVGLLPLPLQAHLLRVLTTRQVRRVGAPAAEPVGVRVLAGTSEDLEVQTQVGGFNPDLYEYLIGHRVQVPPLRERPEDIGRLAQGIADETLRGLGQEPVALGQDVVDRLRGCPFPGNVRQLRRLLEQALQTAAGRRLTAGDLHLPS